MGRTLARHFNSIKVQLRLIKVSEADFARPFQFHKGTIKTYKRSFARSARSVFQFHKGTIKTEDESKRRYYRPYFNSIKVQLRP